MLPKEHSWIVPDTHEFSIPEESEKQGMEIEVQLGQSIPCEINYVLLDAAAWDFSIEDMLTCNSNYTSLFAARGADKDLDVVAPYLFIYNQESEFAEKLKRMVEWDEKCTALYICSHLTIEALRRHFRQFLRVKTENGKWLFFRFYDPVVALSALPFLSSQQKALFFSNIKLIAIEYPKGIWQVVSSPTTYSSNTSNHIPIGSSIILPKIRTGS